MAALVTRALVAVALAACVGEVAGDETAPPDAGVSASPDAARGGVDAPADAAATSPGERCVEVAHIGDSLSAGSSASLAAAYEAAGAVAQIDAFGGRGVMQKLSADPRTGKEAALALRAAGFDGCWVVALGTNDTANIAAGASYTRARSIDEMMAAIDASRAAPVLWVNVFTTRASGPYANANMQLFNDALAEARARWPNLRVFDWAAVAAGGSAPFSDGIHHTAAGYAVRNRAIVEALALLE